jgi:hypothetical protein
MAFSNPEPSRQSLSLKKLLRTIEEARNDVAFRRWLERRQRHQGERELYEQVARRLAKSEPRNP